MSATHVAGAAALGAQADDGGVQGGLAVRVRAHRVVHHGQGGVLESGAHGGGVHCKKTTVISSVRPGLARGGFFFQARALTVIRPAVSRDGAGLSEVGGARGRQCDGLDVGWSGKKGGGMSAMAAKMAAQKQAAPSVVDGGGAHS